MIPIPNNPIPQPADRCECGFCVASTLKPVHGAPKPVDVPAYQRPEYVKARKVKGGGA